MSDERATHQTHISPDIPAEPDPVQDLLMYGLDFSPVLYTPSSMAATHDASRS